MKSKKRPLEIQEKVSQNEPPQTQENLSLYNELEPSLSSRDVARAP